MHAAHGMYKLDKIWKSSPLPFIRSVSNCLARVCPHNHAHTAGGTHCRRSHKMVLCTVLHILHQKYQSNMGRHKHLYIEGPKPLAWWIHETFISKRCDMYCSKMWVPKVGYVDVRRRTMVYQKGLDWSVAWNEAYRISNCVVIFCVWCQPLDPNSIEIAWENVASVIGRWSAKVRWKVSAVGPSLTDGVIASRSPHSCRGSPFISGSPLQNHLPALQSSFQAYCSDILQWYMLHNAAFRLQLCTTLASVQIMTWMPRQSI